MAMTDIESHKADLRIVQEQVRSFFAVRTEIKIYHGSSNSTRAFKFEKSKFVDISKLNRVIEINTQGQFVLVEPNVPMDLLVEQTLKYGLIPPVVPEFPGITVGGGIQGGAEESASFKYGLLHDCCLEYEVILGNGELISASREKNPDLFWGIAGSYGSLGVITLVKLKLIPAKDFVHLTYHTVKSFQEAVSLIKQKSSEPVNFIDGIMFSKYFGVVMIGSFSDSQKLPVSTFSKPNDEWFYLHAKKLSKNNFKYEELVPIRDYIFRYNRGAFWMGRYGFSIFKIPFIKFTRLILNGLFNTRVLYRLLRETNLSQLYFIQDFNLPSEKVLDFFDFAEKQLEIYPVWICPLKPGLEDKLSANYIKTDLVFNIGLWGEVQKDFKSFVKLNRLLEVKSSELKGRKMLYAHSYYPPEEFWKVYDLEWYNSLRKKYSATVTFPDIYEKTLVSEKYKTSILKGVLKVIKLYF